MLVFLNNYASDMTRQLLYRSKETSLLDKVQLITSSFSGVEMLTPDNTAQVISVLGDLNVNRVLITDGAGVILYDSDAGDESEETALGQFALLRPVAEALDLEVGYEKVDGVQTITVAGEDSSVVVTAHSAEAKSGDQIKVLDAEVYVEEPGTTWAPAGLFSLLGISVEETADGLSFTK